MAKTVAMRVVTAALSCWFLIGCGGGSSTTGGAGHDGAAGTGGAGQDGGAGTTGAAGTAGTDGGAAGTTGAAGQDGGADVASGDASDTSVATDGNASDTSANDASDGGACAPNAIVPTAPAVAENRMAADFSNAAAAGGTIADGTYWLTSLTLFTGTGGASTPTGSNRSETLKVTGNTLEVAVLQGSATPTRLTFSLAKNGTTLTLTGTCPASAAQSFSFTATSTTLTLYVPAQGTKLPEVQVYTLANPLCANPFASSAPAVPLNRVAEALPVANATGGTLVPGTYHLTTLTQYTGPGGATGASGSRSETVRITSSAGGFTLEASIAAAAGGFGQWLVLSGTATGTSLMLTQICPTAGSLGTFSYSATATTFTIYNAANSTVEAYVQQ